LPFTVSEAREALKSLDSLRYAAGSLDDALTRIVATTHDLFSVDGAALMLIDPELVLRNAAVSDPRLDHLETLQEKHGTGPCLTAFQDKELVSSEDLAAERRWGEFVTEAVELGLRAVLVSPIPYGNDAVGVIAVFSAKPHPWSPEGELALTSFTDLAALAIAATMQSEERAEVARQLQNALDVRVVVEQAKGVLCATSGLTPRQGFELLRSEARRSRRPIVDVAAEVVKQAFGPGAC
jgi:GAF domain-containing protein